MKHLLLSVLISILCFQLGAQTTGFTGAEAVGNKGISLQYQNDAFGNTDYYYSQGVQLAITFPALKQLFLSKLFPVLSNSTQWLGVALEHNAYTPTSILSDSILYGDRLMLPVRCCSSSLSHIYHG
jgi:hypothetical protein